jgi:heme/copper-type cytochrome/quinol oxidase subunit 2
MMRSPIARTADLLRAALRSRALLAFGIAALVIALAPWPVTAQPVDRTIRVNAGDFAFAPEVLRVNPGDRVTIELVSTDVVHGLAIDGYAVDMTAEPGQTARATFIAGRAGSFKVRCSVACGNLHPFMTGKLEVGPNLLLYRAAALGLLAFAFGAWKTLR